MAFGVPGRRRHPLETKCQCSQPAEELCAGSPSGFHRVAAAGRGTLRRNGYGEGST